MALEPALKILNFPIVSNNDKFNQYHQLNQPNNNSSGKIAEQKIMRFSRAISYGAEVYQ